MKTVIISGGHIDDAFALDWLQSNSYDILIAADSGMDFLYRNKLIPNIIVGDFDSVDSCAYEFFGDCPGTEFIRLNSVKDDTDTEFAVREAINLGADMITILGATGTRLDHVMGNIHLLGIGLQEKLQMQIIDAHNRIRMITGTVSLCKDEQFGKFVSLLPFNGAARGVTLEGFKYPLKDYNLESFGSLGISNEIIEEKATVCVEEGILLLIESRD